MTKSIDTLCTDILTLFKGHEFSDRIDFFSSKIGEILSSRFKSYGEDKTKTLRMSNIGKPLRQLWYELRDTPREELPPEAQLKFLYGDMIEQLMILLAIEAGHTVEDIQREVEVDGIKGHTDALIDGVICDVKSCSSYSFTKFATGAIREDDPFGYIGQIAGYSCAYGNIDGAFLSVDKTLGKICLCKFSGEELSSYDIRRRIQHVRENVASDIEPSRCYEPKPVSKSDKSGNLVLGVGCSYCPFKGHCWRDTNNGEGLKTYYYSTGPKYFVHINKEPRVPPVRDEFPTKED